MPLLDLAAHADDTGLIDGKTFEGVTVPGPAVLILLGAVRELLMETEGRARIQRVTARPPSPTAWPRPSGGVRFHSGELRPLLASLLD